MSYCSSGSGPNHWLKRINRTIRSDARFANQFWIIWRWVKFIIWIMPRWCQLGLGDTIRHVSICHVTPVRYRYYPSIEVSKVPNVFKVSIVSKYRKYSKYWIHCIEYIAGVEVIWTIKNVYISKYMKGRFLSKSTHQIYCIV